MRHKATFVVPSSTCFWWFTVFLCVPFFSDTIHNVRARRPSCRWGQLDCIAVMVIMLSRTEAVITHWQRVSHSWTRRWRDTEWNQRHDSSPWLNLRRRRRRSSRQGDVAVVSVRSRGPASIVQATFILIISEPASSAPTGTHSVFVSVYRPSLLLLQLRSRAGFQGDEMSPPITGSASMRARLRRLQEGGWGRNGEVGG